MRRTSSVCSMLGSTTANSSPPSRASVSCSRRTLGEALGQEAQQLVAELVAQRVVDALEIVQVRHSTAVARPSLAAFSAFSICSRNSRRLGMPVSVSWWAM